MGYGAMVWMGAIVRTGRVGVGKVFYLFWIYWILFLSLLVRLVIASYDIRWYGHNIVCCMHLDPRPISHRRNSNQSSQCHPEAVWGWGGCRLESCVASSFVIVYPTIIDVNQTPPCLRFIWFTTSITWDQVRLKTEFRNIKSHVHCCLFFHFAFLE